MSQLTRIARRPVLVLAVCLLAVPHSLARADDPPAAPGPTDDRTERLKQRGRLTERAKKLAAEGSLDEAIAAEEAGLAIERGLPGGAGDDLSGSLERLSEWYAAVGDGAAALKTATELRDRRTAALGESHWKTADARRALARAEAVARADGERRRALAEALRFNLRVEGLIARGRLDDAERAGRRALEGIEQGLGRKNLDYAGALGNLALVLQTRGNVAAARPLLDRALATCEEVAGPQHPGTIRALNNLGVLLFSVGDLKGARPLVERAVAASRVTHGEEHLDHAQSLENLAVVLQYQGDLDGARPLYERTVAIRRKRLGEADTAYARSLQNLAILLHAKGDLAGARGLLERALAIREAAKETRHPEYPVNVNNLAVVLWSQGDLAGARRRYEQALGAIKAVSGEGHPDYAVALSNLATVLQSQGDLAGARPLLERALALRKATVGEHNPEYVSLLNNLAMLLKAQGDYAAARPLLEQALAASLAEGNRLDQALALQNLASLIQEQGDLAAARPLFERALAVRKEVLGEENADYANTLHNLAALRSDLKDYAGARRMFEQALAIRERTLGPRHPDCASSLNNLSTLLYAQGDYAAARPLCERSLALRKEAFGERHHAYASAMTNLALVLAAQGDLAEARRRADGALAVYEGFLARTLPSLSEREQFALLRQSRGSLEAALSVTAGTPDRDGPGYEHVLAWKGVATETARRRAGGDRPEVRDRLLKLRGLRGRLNRLYYERVAPEQAEAHARAVRALVDERTRLETELAAAVGWKADRLGPDRVAAAVPGDAALVDLVSYRHHPTNRSGPPRPAEWRYAAFVVRRGGPPRRVELGPAEPIDEALASWRSRLQNGGESDGLGRALARLVWEPVAPLIGDSRTVFVAPDGDLCFLPWGALPVGDRGAPLLRRYAVGIFPSARQLVALAESEAAPAAGGLLAVGGVDYGRAESGPAPTGLVATRAAVVNRSAAEFGPLPGAADEAAAVARLYRDSHPAAAADELLSGAAATKARLASAMPGRRYLHLATHGYFAPPGLRSVLSPEDDRTALRSWEGMGRSEVTGFYPGLLSGLAWAGASDPPKDPSTSGVDVGAGLMTAEEVASLDLRGCELAVLSACETGLGRAAGGEGVLGLQRAFHQAGCRTVVASLWRVDDAATRALMERFYANLWVKKLPPLAALRQAQLGVLDDPDLGAGGNPRLWAAWTLSGDPGGLPRLEPPAGAGQPASGSTP